MFKIYKYKYKDSRDKKLEFRMGSDSLDINVVGLAWNPTMIPLDCFTKDNLVNVTDIVNTKLILAFKNVMEKTLIKTIGHYFIGYLYKKINQI